MIGRLTTTVCMTFAAYALQAQSGVRAPDFPEARRMIREDLAKDSALAIALAVVRDGAILWEEGFGWADREKRRPATPRTPFALASLAKTFEATLAFALHQQGRLDLDRPVNDYLRTTRVSSPVFDVRGVTIRRLLTNTAGLSTFNLWCDGARPECRMPLADEMIRQFGVIAQEPGKYFDYSNLGFFVAGEAVARAAGRPLRDLLRDEVFRPLGMADASFGLDSAEAERIAVPFAPGLGHLRQPPSPTGAIDYDNARGFASAHDLALFAAFHMKTHRRDQRAILSDAAIDSMQVPIPSGEYAVGWWTQTDRYGYRSLQAQGGNNLAQAWLRILPSQRVAVVMLVNQGGCRCEAITDAALAALLPRYAERIAVRPEPNTAAPAAAPSGPAPASIVLDSIVVGTWTGRVRSADGDTPIELSFAADGSVKARIGTRSDIAAGTARLSTISGRLIVRVQGDLEAPNPAGLNRAIRFYLRPRGAEWGGHVTTRPPSAAGLEGDVTWWAEISRKP